MDNFQYMMAMAGMITQSGRTLWHLEYALEHDAFEGVSPYRIKMMREAVGKVKGDCDSLMLKLDNAIKESENA